MLQLKQQQQRYDNAFSRFRPSFKGPSSQVRNYGISSYILRAFPGEFLAADEQVTRYTLVVSKQRRPNSLQLCNLDARTSNQAEDRDETGPTTDVHANEENLNDSNE